MIALTVPCCDLCVLAKKSDPEALLNRAEVEILKLVGRIEDCAAQTYTEEAIECEDIDRPKREVLELTGESLVLLDPKSKRSGARRGERLRRCRDALVNWRRKCWQDNHGDCAWDPKVLLPDAIITKLGSRAHVQTFEAVKNEIPDWDFADEHATEVLAVLVQADELWRLEHEQQLQENKLKRKQVSVARKEEQEENHRVSKSLATAKQKALRAQPMASTSRPVLQPTLSALNRLPQTAQPHPPSMVWSHYSLPLPVQPQYPSPIPVNVHLQYPWHHQPPYGVYYQPQESSYQPQQPQYVTQYADGVFLFCFLGFVLQKTKAFFRASL
jgi:hypothetical protein